MGFMPRVSRAHTYCYSKCVLDGAVIFAELTKENPVALIGLKVHYPTCLKAG